jgi:hypothetical protein
MDVSYAEVTNERAVSYVSGSHVYSVSVIIVRIMWICELWYYIGTRRFTIGCVYVLFVGDGVKYLPRHISR